MHKDTAEVVQQHLAAIGIQCELQPAGLVDARQPRHTAASTRSRSTASRADNNDPDGLTAVLDTLAVADHGRSFGLQAPRTAELLAQGRAEFDEAKRVAIYKEMQRAALEEVPLVGLAWRAQGYGMDARRGGLHQPARRADASPPASCWRRPRIG